MIQTAITQIITMNCIGKCNYCMYGSKLNKIQEVPLEDLLNFYGQIEGPLMLKITGGEPLQSNNVDRTINFIKGVKERCQLEHYQINTNGAWGIPQYIFDDEMAEIQISCDASKEYQEKNYGHPYFDDLLKTLEQVRGRQGTWIMMVVTDETEQYCDYVNNLADEYNIMCRMQWVSPVGEGAKFHTYERYKHFRDAIKDNHYDLRHVIPVCTRRHKPKPPEGVIPDDQFQFIGYAVTANGKIVNCPYLSYLNSDELTIYNTKANDIEKIDKVLDSIVKDSTCQFPDGFVDYYNKCSDEEKHIMHDVTDDFERNLVQDALHITI